MVYQNETQSPWQQKRQRSLDAWGVYCQICGAKPTKSGRLILVALDGRIKNDAVGNLPPVCLGCAVKVQSGQISTHLLQEIITKRIDGEG